jgi:hypothetical protein
MSLILDALNRSRQDSEQVPGLGSHHPTDNTPADSEGGIGWVQWLLVAGLALAVLVIGWLLFERMPPAAEIPAVRHGQVPAAETVTVAEAVAAPPAPAAVQDTPVGQQLAMPPQETIQETINAASAVPAAAASGSEPPIRDIPEQEPAPPPVDTSVAALYQQRGQGDAEAPAVRQPAEPADVSAVTSAEEEVIDLEKLVAEAQAELADTKLQDNGVPFLATLSQQTKDSIPTLMYQRHDYSGNSGKSRVLINGKTLSAGAAVGGVKVVEILPDSVVLEFKATRFRLRALNSWVNL